MPPRHFISRLLRITRERAELSQAALGELCGVPQSCVARWESGRLPSLETTVEKVATAMGVTVEQLLRDAMAALRRQERKDRRAKKAARTAPARAR